jgi:hypothetical protein
MWAVCGTGFEWTGVHAAVIGSTFAHNGDHYTKNMWSDGLTLNQGTLLPPPFLHFPMGLTGASLQRRHACLCAQRCGSPTLPPASPPPSSRRRPPLPLAADFSTVSNSLFMDNSDVNLIIGGGVDSTLSGNSVLMRQNSAFAGIMADNFNGATSGNFSGFVLSTCVVDCGAGRCHYGIELGPHAVSACVAERCRTLGFYCLCLWSCWGLA